MRMRQAIGALLLVLAALSTYEIVLDAATHHASLRQPRVRAPHSPLRAPQRNAVALADAAVTAPGPAPGTAVVTGDALRLLAPVPASIFVPPRA